MADGLIHPARGAHALQVVTEHIEQARHQLDLHGPTAIEPARQHLEAAIARLDPLTASDDVPGSVRQAAERCRVTLSSHVLASHDLEAAGVAAVTVAELLRGGADAGELLVTASTES